MSKLVIVESPNKVQTIQKYLGSDYEVMASVGHIMKLSTTGEMGLGINLQTWEPKYVIDPAKKDVVSKLKKAAKGAELIYIATDPDREGESIGENLVKQLKVENKYKRVRYNEITKEAILQAFSNPKLIDEALVSAQKARRMLDRIIGFRLSKLMKQKLSNSPTNPSAGRVQSIALKLIVDREKEIEKFIPQEYNKVEAVINDNLRASIYFEKHNSDQKDWVFLDELDYVKGELVKEPQKQLIVKDIKVSERKVASVTPLKQSVLYKKSPFSATTTQSVAQKLYEGFGDGGLISYPRTDSTRLSLSFIEEARKYIKNKYGENYILEEIKGVAGDQDAHEAIRPTNIHLTPNEAKQKYQLSDNEYKIYKLIYEHTLRALIKAPIRSSKSYTLEKNELLFKLTTSKVIFDGYYIIKDENDNEHSDLNQDPNFEIGQSVTVKEFNITNHFTLPPARYSEGSLIEALDNIKVGRPSTFASTVKIVLDREYAINQNGSLHPTEFGKTVLNKLIEGFPKIINEGYTAEVEEQLDLIAEDKIGIKLVMDSFYEKFTESFISAEENLERTTFTTVIEGDKCPNDGGQLVLKSGKFGKFIGCENYPNCTFTKNQTADEPCPKDGGELVLKNGKFGQFYACSNYPNCKYIKNLKFRRSYKK
ncbi:type I DNA topoisomerase [Mycoplasmopsis iners]|uniref:type I DNA topoisomerase n=1 Tax=Mycoplasmopsis iners TaxID=76630 RepID=UPI000A00EB8F|nr:type I DNA topoisomerase [Mycoplasmopsis iners]